MIFVGADVHVRNTFFYAADSDGQRVARGRVANTSAGLREFCELLLAEAGGEPQPVRFVLESTTNSRAVQRQVRQTAEAAGFSDVAADVLDARKLRLLPLLAPWLRIAPPSRDDRVSPRTSEACE